MSDDTLDGAIGEFRLFLDARDIAKNKQYKQSQPYNSAPVPQDSKKFGRAVNSGYFPDDFPQRGGNFAQGKPLAPTVKVGVETSFASQLPVYFDGEDSPDEMANDVDNNEPPFDDGGGPNPNICPTAGTMAVTFSGIAVCNACAGGFQFVFAGLNGAQTVTWNGTIFEITGVGSYTISQNSATDCSGTTVNSWSGSFIVQAACSGSPAQWNVQVSTDPADGNPFGPLGVFSGGPGAIGVPLINSPCVIGSFTPPASGGSATVTF